MSEHEHQAALFKWAEAMQEQYPELMLLFAVPNGGFRHISTARKLKKEGVKAGVPDVWLPVPRKDYSGLIIEFKFGKNKPTSLQNWWIEKLKVNKYMVAVVWDWIDAKDYIIRYLKL